MKKVFFYAIGILAFVACSKEKESPLAEGQVKGNTVVITTDVSQVKSTEAGAVFSWADNETISVGTSDEEYVTFDIADKNAGTFQHTFSEAAPSLLVAVSPAQQNAAFVAAAQYEIEYPAVYNNYVQGTTNALMVGTPDPNTANRFIFRHVGALLKITYANVPVGTTSFVLDADKNISGTVTLEGTSTSQIEINNQNSELTDSEVWVNLPAPVKEANTTLSFYVPVPTGSYGLLNIYLANSNGKIVATEKTMDRSGKSPLTLARGDVFTFPTITLAPEKIQSYNKVTDSADLEDGDYLIVYEEGNLAFNGSLATLDAVSNTIQVEINNDVIASNSTIDASVFHISAVSGGYNIKSASGYYIGQTSDANGLASSTETAYTNTISIDSDGNATIVSSSAHLRYNSASNQTRFRYYKSSSYTGQKAIALYKFGTSTAWTLESISVTKGPDKTEYEVGETFDPTGMVVTAHYVDAEDSNNTKDEDVTGYTISPDGALSLTDTEVTITFGGKSTTQSITVVKWVLDGIAITTEPTKTTYDVGETFDPAGLVVKATFKDSKDATNTKEIDIDINQLVFNPTTSTSLTKDITSITISYTKDEVTKTASQAITVNVASGWIETAIADLASDDVFVIVGNNGDNYAMSNDNGTTSAPGAVEVTVSGNKITSDVAKNIKWNISGNATDGYTFYPNGSTTTWLYCTNTNNGVRVGSGDAKHFTQSGGYLTTSETQAQRFIGIYNSSDWRCYESKGGNIANQTFKFYRFVDPREAAPISWPNATETATKEGSTITWGNGSAPVLSNTENLDVSYSSSNESVATIASDGTISVVGGGSTVIKAFYTGTTYKDTEKTFTLTVTDNTTYTISCNSNNTSYGTVSASPASAKANATVMITITPAEGYKLKSISAKDGSDNAISLTTVDASHRSFTMPTSNVTITAIFEEDKVKSVTDILTRATTGVTSGSTSYSTWNDKTGTSGAVYAGNSAGGNDAIQLRSDKSNSGVVTTTSGGKVTKIKVTWNSNTASGRTLNIYGKNSAYSQASDLYNTSNQGTLLGTIVKGTSTELTISGDYTHIGFRSSSGALYLDKVEITWES